MALLRSCEGPVGQNPASVIDVTSLKQTEGQARINQQVEVQHRAVCINKRVRKSLPLHPTNDLARVVDRIRICGIAERTKTPHHAFVIQESICRVVFGEIATIWPPLLMAVP